MTGASPARAVEHRLPLGPGPDVLAAGAWFNNTVCAVKDGVAALSPAVGDLDTVAACRAHEEHLTALAHWVGPGLRAVVHDLHPDFHSTTFAQELADRLGVPTLAVQHHHAHIASVCAEHAVTDPVVGLALDGVGLGSDGTAWGGELLAVRGANWARLGGLVPLALPGGDRAAREPWRMAASVLHALGRGDEITTRYASHPAAARLSGLLDAGRHAPLTSSLGRVFDAAAGLLGLCEVMTAPAQAAIALESAAAGHGPVPPEPDGWRLAGDGRLDLLPLLAVVADEPDPGRGAARFHATVVAALADWALAGAGTTGTGTVVFGGGCFFNAILRGGLRDRLAGAGLRVLEPRVLLPGDTAIALGQAQVARLALESGAASSPVSPSATGILAGIPQGEGD